jgi:hypothetical protein
VNWSCLAEDVGLWRDVHVVDLLRLYNAGNVLLNWSVVPFLVERPLHGVCHVCCHCHFA